MEMPKGSLLKWYLPNGVIKVVSGRDSGDNGIGQNPLNLQEPTVWDGSIRMLIPYHVTPAHSAGQRKCHVEDPSLVEQVVTLHLTKTPEELCHCSLRTAQLASCCRQLRMVRRQRLMK